jgi:H+/Cl- antiporter ClcA
MDMLRATGGSGSPPTSYAAAAGSAEVGNPSTDSNWASIIHAVATTAAFVLLMPAGIIFLRVLPENVRWHWINQSLALGLAVVGGGIGIYLSSMFNKSKSYNSSHQILGLLAIGFMFVQWILGFWHHHLYRKTQQTSRYGPIHRWFGRGVMVLAIVTGGIGLTWSYASTRVVIGYVIAVVVLMVAVIVSLVWKKSVSRSWTITRGTNRKFGRSFSDSGVHLTEYADLSRERSS